jgi:bifunctional non-homologous end joining protein LigD
MTVNDTRMIDGHRVTITHPDKVMYPSTGMTKSDVVDYLEAIAPHLLRHAAGRAATRKRWVDGVGTAEVPGEGFFHKNLDDGAPSWVRARTLKHADHSNRYPLLDSVAVLAWYAQHGTLEFHVPQWRFGVHGKQLPPDRVVIDLDPGPGVTLGTCAEVATLVRAALARHHIESVPVTSGSKGIHVYGALDGSLSADAATEMVRDLAHGIEEEHPHEVTARMSKAERSGWVFLDWSQNRAAKSTVAPYSLRGRLRPWVACPRSWEELGSPGLSQVEYDEALALVERRGDPLAAITAQ